MGPHLRGHERRSRDRDRAGAGRRPGAAGASARRRRDVRSPEDGDRSAAARGRTVRRASRRHRARAGSCGQAASRRRVLGAPGCGRGRAQLRPLPRHCGGRHADRRLHRGRGRRCRGDDTGTALSPHPTGRRLRARRDDRPRGARRRERRRDRAPDRRRGRHGTCRRSGGFPVPAGRGRRRGLARAEGGGDRIGPDEPARPVHVQRPDADRSDCRPGDARRRAGDRAVPPTRPAQGDRVHPRAGDRRARARAAPARSDRRRGRGRARGCDHPGLRRRVRRAPRRARFGRARLAAASQACSSPCSRRWPSSPRSQAGEEPGVPS